MADAEDIAVGDVVLAIGNPLRLRSLRVTGHRLRCGPLRPTAVDLRGLHPDRCHHPPGQLRRGPDRSPGPLGRHQHADLYRGRRAQRGRPNGNRDQPRYPERSWLPWLFWTTSSSTASVIRGWLGVSVEVLLSEQPARRQPSSAAHRDRSRTRRTCAAGGHQTQRHHC